MIIKIIPMENEMNLPDVDIKEVKAIDEEGRMQNIKNCGVSTAA